jgi:hypothetical protein
MARDERAKKVRNARLLNLGRSAAIPPIRPISSGAGLAPDAADGAFPRPFDS